MDPISIAKLGLTAFSLFSKKKEDKSGQLDLARLRQQAKENGFNPLTVLQSTGGAGFTTGAQIPSFLSLAASAANNALSDYEQSQAMARAEARQIANDDVSNNFINAQTENLRSAPSSGVVGPYGNSYQLSSPASGYSTGFSSGVTTPSLSPYSAQSIFSDRETEIEPVKNTPIFGDVALPSGRTVTAINPDLELEGPVQWFNSAYIATAAAGDTMGTSLGNWFNSQRSPVSTDQPPLSYMRSNHYFEPFPSISPKPFQW